MIIIVCCWAILPFSPLNALAEEAVVVIANKDVPSEKLTPDKIKKIFLGEVMNWENNEVITVVLLGDETVHKEFIHKYIKRTPAQFLNVWRRNLFTGKGAMPTQMDNIDDLIKYVANTKGAIGYVPADANLTGNVKIIDQK